MITDPISDLLTRIRNSIRAHKLETSVPHSKIKLAILEVLKKRHFITSYKVVKVGSFNEIMIELNPEKKSLELKRVSKPGQRIYVKQKDIKPVMNGYGIGVLSTPKGIMAHDEARKKGLGGELICEVW